ncbi:hypothetical protein Cantr_00798 [Candida viswanathii]|uniref:Hyphally-regulated cell wall protein N-terminal domain-containing protein n=1 Tax=Candida viswanathii TaxID=5486 RepID=A0A367YGZ6_9ASCO|nr:hypothetical protein Cantr_00798 [Candida viswanathii]
MDGQSAILAKTSATSSCTIKVYGCGNGNMLGLDQTLVGQDDDPGYSYSSITGILVLHGSAKLVAFDIGPNYDDDLFELTTHSKALSGVRPLNAVRYNGPIPLPLRELPETCQVECKPIPVAPGIEPDEYAITVKITNV